MHRRAAWFGALVSSAVACYAPGQSEPREGSRPTPERGSVRVPTNTDRVDTPFLHGDTRQIDGLQVVYELSGRVTVRGTDRWGQPLDRTYESAEFFRAAVPTLGRGMTDAQAAKLGVLAEHIGPSAHAVDDSVAADPAAMPSGSLP